MVSAQKLLKTIMVVSVLLIGLLAYKVGPAGTLLFPLLPLLLPIVPAIATRQVLPALFAGVWVAGLRLAGHNPVAATSKTLEWIVASASDSWNAIILVFLAVIARRHIGPMLKVEHRAVQEGKMLRDNARPLMPTEEVLKVASGMRKTSRWVFIASILALVTVTLLGI